ncbi:MAG: BrnT family toxin [Pseudomonadota bacterium]
MEFEWDEAKSETCFTERGFDFAYAVRAFLDPNRVVRADDRWDYGEDRYQLVAAIEGRVFLVVYTVRGKTIRIISARKANRREVHDYENASR